MSNAVLYGEMNMNVIDGSSIWVTSIASVLANVFDEVHVQLRTKLTTENVVAPLREIANVFIHEPNYESLSLELARDEVKSLVRENHASVLFTRGMAVAESFSGDQELAEILWAYVTDLPFPSIDQENPMVQRIRSAIARCRRFVVQTEATRSYVEGIAPEAAGKTIVLNPMLPSSAFRENTARSASSGERLEIVYAGKFDSDWKTLELLDLPEQLSQLGIDARLRILGDSVRRSTSDSTWQGRMTEDLQLAKVGKRKGVEWLGALTREEVADVLSQCHIGISWRTSALDSSLELSTKVLEYLAAGVLPVLNETSDHVELLGQDYPLFTNGSTTAEQLAIIIKDAIPGLDKTFNSVQTIPRGYSFTAASRHLAQSFQRARVLDARDQSDPQVKLAIASHDLKFMAEVVDELHADPRFDLRIDHWSSLHDNDARASKEILDWADVILCEWAGPNLEWYSNRVHDGQRLIARLHGFELRGPWLRNVNLSRVDHIIYVSDFWKAKAKSAGLGDVASSVIPNMIDVSDLRRTKWPWARKHIGVAGYVNFNKRPDRALDLLEMLIAEDDEFVLHFKGAFPWQYNWEWKKPVQKQQYLEFFARLAENERLREHVAFDHFSADIGSWLRGIGYVLSPSEFESFHLAPAEGMASGAIPVFWDREGVDELFPQEFIFDSTRDAADYILALNSDEVKRDRARATSMCEVEQYDRANVIKKWHQVLARNVE